METTFVDSRSLLDCPSPTLLALERHLMTLTHALQMELIFQRRCSLLQSPSRRHWGPRKRPRCWNRRLGLLVSTPYCQLQAKTDLEVKEEYCNTQSESRTRNCKNAETRRRWRTEGPGSAPSVELNLK